MHVHRFHIVGTLVLPHTTFVVGLTLKVWLQISLRIRTVWFKSYNVRLSVKETLIDSSADSVAHRSACADARSYIVLHCPHMVYYRAVLELTMRRSNQSKHYCRPNEGLRSDSWNVEFPPIAVQLSRSSAHNQITWLPYFKSNLTYATVTSEYSDRRYSTLQL